MSYDTYNGWTNRGGCTMKDTNRTTADDVRDLCATDPVAAMLRDAWLRARGSVTTNNAREGNGTMSYDTYNGWTNRETWLVNLWDIANYDIEELEVYRGNEYALSKEIENRVDEIIEMSDQDGTLSSGFVGDLLGGALARIDYYDIASTLLRDLPDEDEEY